MGKEYNLLTKQLLKAGYTAENYPDYVRVGTSRLSGDDPLNNLDGGFEYKRWKIDEFVYKTGCGKYVKGRNVLDNMSYMGVEWTHENNNPVFRCPYDNPECQYNDKRFYGITGGGVCIQCWCTCHRTEDIYDYKNSIEKANDDRKAETDRKYQEYSDLHNGRICRNHMFYNERTRTWAQCYEPYRCTRTCFSQNGYCPILGKQLSKKHGNVYYDLKTSGIRNDDTLWNGERWTNIRKNIRYFKKPCSMDICEAFIKNQKEKIASDYRLNHASYFMMDPTLEFEILNIRAESRPSRDLEQDLADLQAGISIVFDDIAEKQAKEYKKQKRQQAQEKRIAKLEKKILDVGYWNLEEYSIDRIHADKWLGEERINELEEIRQQKIKEEQEKPVQLSLFDMM